jgi:putative membrane protein
LSKIKTGFLLAGIALFGVVIWETDFQGALLLVGNMGVGFALILALYFAAFLIDALAWQLTATTVPVTAVWLYRFYQVRLVGEAFNNITPAASVGGEPIKAILLKRCYGIDYREGVVSLILSKTLIVATLVVFLAIGFAMMIWSQKMADYSTAALTGLIIFSGAVLLFFLVQRFKLSSLIGNKLATRPALSAIKGILDATQDVDDRLVHFYTAERVRFVIALGLSFLNWVLGVAEIYYTMKFIGHPISFWDAWIIEAVAQMVRSALFFIPAAIGAQEGAMVIIGTAITGSPTLGLATALIRRLREVMWILWGLLVFYVLKPAEAEEARRSRRAAD